MNNISQQIGLVVLAGAVVLVGLLGWMESGRWRKDFGMVARTDAIQGCMEVGRIEYVGKEGQPNAQQPNWEIYKKCLEEKGVK